MEMDLIIGKIFFGIHKVVTDHSDPDIVSQQSSGFYSWSQKFGDRTFAGRGLNLWIVGFAIGRESEPEDIPSID